MNASGPKPLVFFEKDNDKLPLAATFQAFRGRGVLSVCQLGHSTAHMTGEGTDVMNIEQVLLVEECTLIGIDDL